MAALLSSLKILDFSTLLPGPFASMMLADLGADILRIEAPQSPRYDTGEASLWRRRSRPGMPFSIAPSALWFWI